MFKTATKTKSKLRMAIIGPSGGGKTFSALRIGTALGSKVAVIDTERGSASKYSDLFKFDVAELQSHSPQDYIAAIQAAESAGYDVLIIDSLSHAWTGKDGALEQVDKAAKRSQSHNTYMAWRDVTPLHNRLVDAMLQSNCHIIATMRAKTEYVLEQNAKGHQVPRKVGLAPIQRDGMEYEFDVTADITADHELLISKTRCSSLDGKVFSKPGEDVAGLLKAWLSDGAEAEVKPAVIKKPESEASTLGTTTDVLPVEDASEPEEDYRSQLQTYAAMMHIPEGYIAQYLKKKGLAHIDPVRIDLFETAVRDVDKVAEIVVVKTGSTTPTAEQVTDDILKAAFREVLSAK